MWTNHRALCGNPKWTMVASEKYVGEVRTLDIGEASALIYHYAIGWLLEG